eukprot:7807288-Lingulodinium_polyedra.AAC.1
MIISVAILAQAIWAQDAVSAPALARAPAVSRLFAGGPRPAASAWRVPVGVVAAAPRARPARAA